MTKNYHKDNLKQIFQEAQKEQSALFQLLQYGRQQGFDNFINRRLIWPFLLGLNQKQLKSRQIYEWKVKVQQRSPQYSQIVKDSQRSLTNLRTYQTVSKFHLKKKQQAVRDTLNSLFINNNQLNYIQGFHDIASIFLTVFDNNLGYYLTEKAAQTYFYDYLKFQPEINARVTSQIIFDIVTIRDQSFKNIFSFYHDTKMLIFIFSWVMTWFSHVFTNLKTICRLWDYLLCTGPHGIFYLTSALILNSKVKLIQYCQSFNQANITAFYQQYIKGDIDIEQMIKTAIYLQSKIIISELPAYQLLERKSKYRVQNFNKLLEIHERYHKERFKQINRQKKFKSVVMVGGALLLLGAAFLLKNKVRINQVRDL